MSRLFGAVGLFLFLVLSLFLVVFGGLYASVKDLLWFHAAAVSAESVEAVRPLYFALMKLIGGAAISLGAATAYIALGPLRRGAAGAATALFVCHAIPLVMAAIVAETLAARTGAPTSWRIMGALLGVDAAAFVLAVVSRRPGRATGPVAAA